MRADLKRRRFLLALGAAGAGATAVAARSITAGSVVEPAPEAVSGDGGYAATAARPDVLQDGEALIANSHLRDAPGKLLSRFPGERARRLLKREHFTKHS